MSRPNKTILQIFKNYKTPVVTTVAGGTASYLLNNQTFQVKMIPIIIEQEKYTP